MNLILLYGRTPPNTPAFLRQVYYSFRAGNPTFRIGAVVVVALIVLVLVIEMVRAAAKRRNSARMPNFRGAVTVTHVGLEFARPLKMDANSAVEVAVMKPVTCLTGSDITMRIDLPCEHWEVMTRGATGILAARGSHFISFTPATVPPIETKEETT